MDFFDGRYYRINKLLLWSVGLWPYQGKLSRVVTLAIGIFGLSSLCVPQVLYVMEVLTDLEFESVFSSLPTCFGGLIAAAKALSFWYKSNEVKSLLQRMRNDWDDVTIESELNILVSYARNGRLLTWGYAVFATGPIMIFVSLPFTVPLLDIILPLNQSRARVLAYPAEYFVDLEKYYYLLQLNEWLGCFISLTVTAAADTLYVMLIQHVCGMFALSSYRLRNLNGPGINQWKDNKTGTTRKSDCDQIMNCINLHKRTINISICTYIRSPEFRFAELIDSTFSTFFIFDISLGFITQSSSCVMIVVRVDRKAEAVRYGSIVIGQSLRLFFNSWIGQRLMDHSLDICNAAYGGKWYNTSCKTKKLLLLVMMRCRIPCKVSVMKLYVMNLEGFSKVVRASLSYCTVMTSIREGQEE